MNDNSISILVVDDDANYRRILTDYLSNKGYNVKSVFSAEDAIAVFKKGLFQYYYIRFDVTGEIRHRSAECCEIKGK